MTAEFSDIVLLSVGCVFIGLFCSVFFFFFFPISLAILLQHTSCDRLSDRSAELCYPRASGLSLADVAEDVHL